MDQINHLADLKKAAACSQPFPKSIFLTNRLLSNPSSSERARVLPQDLL